MTGLDRDTSKSPDRTGVCCAGRCAPSQCETITGPSFSSLNKPDQERTPAYRDSSGSESPSGCLLCYFFRRLGGAIWGIPGEAEDKQCALMVLANPSYLAQFLEAAVRSIKIETLEFRESSSYRTEIEQKAEKCKELASRCWTDTASCERAKEIGNELGCSSLIYLCVDTGNSEICTWKAMRCSGVPPDNQLSRDLDKLGEIYMEISTPLGAERMRRNYEIFIRSPESDAERARMAEQIRQQLEAKGYGFEPLLTDDEYSELGRDASVVGDRLGLLTLV